jgi:hypothetical protein
VSVKLAEPEHEATYQELLELVNRRAGELTPLEILAVAANVVGKLIAMQDLRTTTPELAMSTVIQNIEFGNHQMIEQLERAEGHKSN